MSKRKENKLRDEKPRVNKALEGLEIRINSFGEIHNSLSIDKINEFLNKNVDDKKLRDRDDIDEIKGDGLEKGE
jgi:hypothetical protein